MKKITKRLFCALCLCMMLLLAMPAAAVFAKPVLSTRRLTLQAGQKASVKVLKLTGKERVRGVQASDTAVVKVRRKGKGRILLTAKKVGNAKVVVRIRGRKKALVLRVKVEVPKIAYVPATKQPVIYVPYQATYGTPAGPSAGGSTGGSMGGNGTGGSMGGNGTGGSTGGNGTGGSAGGNGTGGGAGSGTSAQEKELPGRRTDPGNAVEGAEIPTDQGSMKMRVSRVYKGVEAAEKIKALGEWDSLSHLNVVDYPNSDLVLFEIQLSAVSGYEDSMLSGSSLINTSRFFNGQGNVAVHDIDELYLSRHDINDVRIFGGGSAVGYSALLIPSDMNEFMTYLDAKGGRRFWVRFRF